MILIILVFVVGLIAMFPLKKLAQKIYNETGYNGVRGLPKFLTIFFAIINIFLGFVLYVTIEEHIYNFAVISVAIMLSLIFILALVSKKAGLKNAILLAILQTISGVIMVILLLVHHFLGGISSSGFLDILSIEET
jgi:hypothetical protein